MHGSPSLISEISVEDSVAFQNEWNSIKKKKDKIYISYDSTNKTARPMFLLPSVSWRKSK
jgi:hypothetical protein